MNPFQIGLAVGIIIGAALMAWVIGVGGIVSRRRLEEERQDRMVAELAGMAVGKVLLFSVRAGRRKKAG